MLLNVASCNISGLREESKRRSLFLWLRKQNCDIVFLQETHCHLKKDEYKWSREWDGQSLWSRGTNRSKGVAILFNRKQQYDIQNKVIDGNGRYIMFDLCIDNKKYRFINIYAPNGDFERVNFFINVSQWIDPDIETLIAGDFNCALDSEIDRKNCIGSKDIGSLDLKKIMHTHNLEDVWRRRHPEKRAFSWNRGNKFSRIDYWLISESLDNQTESIEYQTCAFSDHKLVKLSFRTSESPHGNGVWKLNEMVIKSTLFQKSFTAIWNNWQKEKHKYENLNIWWDLGKHKIKKLAIWCSYKLEQDKKDEMSLLESKIEYLENVGKVNETQIAKENLKKLMLVKSEGARIRSRVIWFEQGEKSSKYFHSLEKKNSKDKLWHDIKDKEGNIVTGVRNIQKVQVDFYENLYKAQGVKQDNVKQFTDVLVKRISNESKQNLNRDMNLDELYKALQKMKRNKTPGPDGLTVEFYQMYWDVIKNDLIEVYQHSFEIEQLAYTQYLALITLLFKKGARENITNWRPISLINVDSKLLSKFLAERLKLVLPEIIHTDQKGCIKGRFIGQNIRLVEDILDQYDEDEVILLLDQQKAFDRVEWDWLFQVMEKMNLGENFIRWVKLMYKNMKSAIITNGYKSQYFSISRGIRQGDSLSALLYVLQIEPLAEYIRQCDDIRGIKLLDDSNEEHECKISLYVDDGHIILKYIQDIDKVIQILDKFGLASGSKLNKEKTIGLVTNNNNENCRTDFTLTTEPKKVLGVPIGKIKNRDKYWSGIIEKIKNRMLPWQLRNLSLQGKIHIINSVGLSNVYYGCEMVTIEKKHVDECMDLIWKYIWNKNHVYFKTDMYVTTSSRWFGVTKPTQYCQSKKN